MCLNGLTSKTREFAWCAFGIFDMQRTQDRIAEYLT